MPGRLGYTAGGGTEAEGTLSHVRTGGRTCVGGGESGGGGHTCVGGGGGGGRDELEGKGPQRRPQRRLGRRLEEVAKAVGGGYCRLQMPLRLALGVRGTVAGHRLGALEEAGRGGGGGLPPPFQCIPRGEGRASLLFSMQWIRRGRSAWRLPACVALPDTASQRRPASASPLPAAERSLWSVAGRCRASVSCAAVRAPSRCHTTAFGGGGGALFRRLLLGLEG